MKQSSTTTPNLLRGQKNISLLLIAAMLMWALGLPLWINSVNAASLVNISDTISDSDKIVVADHTIQFTTSDTGQLIAGETIVLTFESGFTMPDALDYTDMDMSIATIDQALDTNPSGVTWGVSVATTTRVITITSGTGTIGTSTDVVIKIGTNATAGDQQITNPNTAKSYTIDIEVGSTSQDTGQTRVAILDDVSVTASVDTTFTFTVSAVNAGLSINGEGTTTSATSTATSMAFGKLVANTPKVMAQQLSVITNASNGFTVTIQQDRNLISASTADIDLFVDGNATSTPGQWVAPTGTPGSENTYGHYGITSEDSSLSGGDEFSTAYYAGNLDSPREVFYHTSVADGTTQHVGSTRIAVKIEIGSLQEAATDYSNTLTYVATPIF